MSVEHTCHYCEGSVVRKPSDFCRNGRPRKRVFCNDECYNAWRASRHVEIKRKRNSTFRAVWGTIPAGRFDVATARPYGKQAERRAFAILLPKLGFTDIVDFSSTSNQFFVDFVATYHGRRVLVDATIKIKAYIPAKVKLALALQMPLYILHLSAVRDDVFWLHEVKNAACVRVPSSYFSELESRA